MWILAASMLRSQASVMKAFTSAAAGRRPLWPAVLLVMCGCGGGDGEAQFALTINHDFVTPSEQANLSGTVSLPSGSQREGGTVTTPLLTCQLGPHSMKWSNSTNGTTGAAFAFWDCPADFASWTAVHIPLSTGANRVTVTIADSSRTAEASVVITRN
jgi:hypothetical protein